MSKNEGSELRSLRPKLREYSFEECNSRLSVCFYRLCKMYFNYETICALETLQEEKPELTVVFESPQ